MYPEKEIIIFHVESALHAGAGANIGHTDNPVQRETPTRNPIVQASGVKGALREFYEKTVSDNSDIENKMIDAAFGKEKGERDEKDGAGAVAFGEAKLLFFPVRSLAGIFAYITCPSIIARFQRDLSAVKNKTPFGRIKSEIAPIGYTYSVDLELSDFLYLLYHIQMVHLWKDRISLRI